MSTTSNWHPWRQLRGLTDVVVHWVRPTPTAPGATDGERVIWLDPRLLQVERRCVLSHELVHVEMGHRGCQPRSVEALVRRVAACRLVPLSALLDGTRWAMSYDELAQELWVTESVLADRIAALGPADWAQIIDATSHHHP